MANPGTIKVRAAHVTHGLVVKITGRRTFGARCWLAVKVFELGAAILGCGIEVELTKAPREI